MIKTANFRVEEEPKKNILYNLQNEQNERDYSEFERPDKISKFELISNKDKYSSNRSIDITVNSSNLKGFQSQSPLLYLKIDHYLIK